MAHLAFCQYNKDMALPAPQRRSNYRVTLLRRCTVMPSGRGAAPVELIDLSGTGCGFLSRAGFVVGDRGRIHIEFPDWTLSATYVVRATRSQRATRYIGVEFEGHDTTRADEIIREVFAEQRRQLRNVRGGATA